MPGRQEHGRRLESLHEHAAFAVDRRRERTADSIGAPRFQPVFRRAGQGSHDLDVINGVERAELKARGADGGELGLIDLRHNASDPFAIPAGQKLLSLDKLEMRVEHMAVQGPALHVERRRESRHSRIEQTRELLICQKPKQAFGRGHVDLRHVET